MIDVISARLLLYVVAFAFVLASVATVEAVPGNGSRRGLRLLLWPLVFYAGGLMIATLTKLCSVDTNISQWIFTVPAALTIICQVVLWRWWKSL